MSGEKESIISADTSSFKEEVSESSFSPLYNLRLDEKTELANLNDRLACYISHVRNLKNENNRLREQVKQTEEKLTQEVTNIKTIFESELSDTRKLIDELLNEKAKLEVDTVRLFKENKNLNKQLMAKSNEITDSKNMLSSIEEKLAVLTSRCTKLQNENKKLTDENTNLQNDKEKLTYQLNETKFLLDEITLLKIQFENNLQTVKEQLIFKEQMFEKQLSESMKKQKEIDEIDSRLAHEYEENLCKHLQQIREEYEDNIEANSEEIKTLYEDKIVSLQDQLSRNNVLITKSMDEIKNLQKHINELDKRLLTAEEERDAALQEVHLLERKLEKMRSEYILETGEQDKIITKLREQMSSQLRDFEELMNIKVALDMEITAYRKLLEGEEERLNISQVSGESSPRKLLKIKRKRPSSLNRSDYTIKSNSKCNLIIDDICPNGSYVHIFNKSNDNVSLNGWKLSRSTNDNVETFSYTFQENINLDSNTGLTIWSDGCLVKDNVKNIVMLNKTWPISDNMLTLLIDNNGHVMATMEHKKMIDVKKLRKHPFKKLSFEKDQEQDEEKCVIF